MLADESNATPAATGQPADSSHASLTPHPPRSLLTRGGGNTVNVSFGNKNSNSNSDSNTKTLKRLPAATLPDTTAVAAPMRDTPSPTSELGPAATAPIDGVLQTGKPNFSTQLDFLTTNRTVAALERAVERLELLSLLDATGPVDDAAAAESNSNGNSKKTATASVGAAKTGLMGIGGAGLSATRGAAILEGDNHDASLATAQKVGEALAVSQQQGNRGRPTVLELLAEQRLLERRYGELLVQTQPVVSLRPGEPQMRKQCFGNVQDAHQVALQQELAHVSSRLRDTNRLLCTQLEDNPQDADNWAKISNERRELTALLKEVIAELTTGYRDVFQYHQQRGRKSDMGSTNSNTTNRAGSIVMQRTHTASGESGDPGARLGGTADSPPSHSAGANASPFTRTNSELGSQQTTLKRFGSTVQRRSVSRSAYQAPRIPLASSYHQFAVKVLQEKAAQQWADDVLAKERALNQNVKQLQADLVRERELKEREVAERKARVAELQLELRRLKGAMQQRTEAAKARGEAATEGLQRDGAAEISEVRQAAQRNERLLTVEADTHSAFAEFLQQRTAATDALASEWEAKTQRELKKKETAKIDVENSRQGCAQRLSDLDQEQSVQMELKKQREAKTKAEEDERQRAEDQRAAEYTAASVLEAAIKAMMTRQTLAKLKKGSKKKKKKS
ncbi:putative mitochondrial hypothetical protein [Leptomonas pyrrhocoris]|uniref:Dynein regulatory complex protein 9 n=1 Tax=Leptomonas pyrrhocoris TaxID=157538 RepID=A0A0N0VFR9_LEPPY|nr:putative mitochondrial hypothetical protein [Leptomonas pyrrhocoris]XP_015659898.1 putative mitochondrial hypothetical protein [Leptomonas pyrrhocoris]XP_015659899.1 putative mitochondrial hypothetical protein [Leptomonas pyrrhocoris]XP_015659900.1 putative mitochondrial hypothetical protein [Leptomonas pyrrhocoris]KPA81458.1 putative mitochondrial hypothetical protein [Leptomonas pyrrhocoris]KPA81459.1 putative mitochondrial hypothetical protein [Leptomonas pyrrhocoris]KPA81460.1 putative|eukprot:XP_015659897.1 putative mitochondrial hypothetical protein [Leptomonas pyrrhocoris]